MSESCMSTNSGCCFSRSTRSLLTTAVGRTICTGGDSSMRTRRVSTTSSRSTLAASPMARSCLLSRRVLKPTNSISTPAPICSARFSHEKWKNSDSPTRNVNSSASVPPVKPSECCIAPPITSPSTPPGARGSFMCSEYMRMASKPMLEARMSAKPIHVTLASTRGMEVRGRRSSDISSRQPRQTLRTSSTAHQ